MVGHKPLLDPHFWGVNYGNVRSGTTESGIADGKLDSIILSIPPKSGCREFSFFSPWIYLQVKIDGTDTKR